MVTRISFVLLLALLIGLAQVHLRNVHRQRVLEMTRLRAEAERIRHELWQQRVEVARHLHNPQTLRERLADLDANLYPLGMAPTDEGLLAQGRAAVPR